MAVVGLLELRETRRQGRIVHDDQSSRSQYYLPGVVAHQQRRTSGCEEVHMQYCVTAERDRMVLWLE